MRSRLLAGVLAAASLGVAAEEVVKVGCVAPLTGPQAHLGKDIENGCRLAVDEINAKGPKLGGQPVRFELLVEDDQADPKTATLVAQKLVDNGVKGVVGHLNSGASIPASRIYSDAGIAPRPSRFVLGSDLEDVFRHGGIPSIFFPLLVRTDEGIFLSQGTIL